MFHFILKKFIKIIHINIYTETLHVSDTSKYRAVDYIQLKCVKQYNKKEPLTEKYRVQLLEFETDATTLQ